jgi:outer membrane autotransporter protein
VCTVSGSTLTILKAGACTIQVSQDGDSNYTPAKKFTKTITIDKAAATVGLTSSPNPSNSGESVKFVATVQPSAATGTVTFKDGATTLGTVPVAGGLAQLQTTSLAPGSRLITAQFSGDANYLPASASVTQVVINTGKLTLKVVTVDDDGAFAFSSSAPALNLTLTTTGKVAQSAPIDLVAGTYSVAIAPPAGFGLTSISCSDGDSSGAPASKLITLNISPSETVTCTVGAANSARKTAGIIGKFMGKRADMLLSQGPDAGRQIDRLIDANAAAGKTGAGAPSEGKTAASVVPTAPKVAGGPRSFEERLSELRGDDASGAPSPFGVQGSSEGSASLSFSTSLSKAMALGAKTKPDGSPAAPLKPSLFDIWTEVRYTSFDDARGGIDTGGHFGIAYLGADYIVSRNLLVGVLAQFDDMEETSRAGGYRIGGKGWMVGPYATLRLSEHLYLQGRAAWGKSANTVSPYGTYTDDFATVRWLASAAMVGHWTFGNWQLRPAASIARIEDTSAAYVDALGVTIPGLKVSLGQFKAGPEVSYRFNLPGGTVIEPRLGAHLIWNFDASRLPVDLGGTLSGPEGARGRIELGVGLKFNDGVMIDLGAGYDGIGSDDFSAVTGKATVRVPLN